MTDDEESRICQKCGKGQMRPRRVRENQPEHRTYTREYVCDNSECNAKSAEVGLEEVVQVGERVSAEKLSGTSQ